MRERARAAYLIAALTLATDADATRDHDTAIRYYLRIVEHDQLHEDAHLRLVHALADAGRHGDGLRSSSAMREIGAESAPYRALPTRA